MKRRRKPIAYGAETSNTEDCTQRSGPSITDLPNPVLVDILLKLSAKSIVMCKSVCKDWYNLISSHQFADMHFTQSKPCAFVRTMEKTRISRVLYMVQPEDIHGFNFGDCSCEVESDDRWEIYCSCYKSMKLDSKLKIPLRNARVALDKKRDANVTPDAKDNTIRKRCTKLNLKLRDHKCSVVNSCNGLLCLSEPSRNDPVAVCNPITGEFVGLPSACHTENEDTFIDCGLGFSPKNNQYKVIRIVSRWRHTDPFFPRWHDSTVAEVHTLGTGSWRSIGKAPYSRENKLAFPTYLNGFLHWLFKNHNGPDGIVSFDLDNEQFQSVPLPAPLGHGLRHCVSVGVLRGCLCVCIATGEFRPFNLWIMQSYGVRESWTKLVSIASHDEKWPRGLYQPISCSKDDELLLFHYSCNALISYNLKSLKFKFLKLHGLKSWYEAIVHIPRLSSLEDILEGVNVKIHNINSRCGKLKLPGETKALLLEGKNGDSSDSDSNCGKCQVWKNYCWKKETLFNC